MYLNGVEVVRDNLAPGATFSTPSIEGAGYDDGLGSYGFDVPIEELVQGRNVLAVEVHQVGPTSSDLSFDLKLSGVESDAEPD